MTDNHWFAPGHQAPAPSPVRAGELLFEFIRPSDREPIRCELWFNGESYGWESQFHDRDGLWYSRGGFALRREAICWSELERDAVEKGGVV